MIPAGSDHTDNCTLENWQLPEEFDESTRALVKVTGTDWDTDVEVFYADTSTLSTTSEDLPEQFGGNLDLVKEGSDNTTLSYQVNEAVSDDWNIELLAFEHNGKLLYPAE